MRAGRLTCHSLVQQYLRRIESYDKRGPAINSIVVINPGALAEADDLDRRFKATGPVGPLHCVPAIVKDNFETTGLQSADGSLALEGFISNRDAFLVGKIKAAGAIVLAKSNMSTRMSVLLPAPFGPSNPKISPAGTSNVTPRSATVWP